MEMKSLVFDTGPIISLTMNNLLWILNPLKQRLRGNFYITAAVQKELVERPLQIKKFEFEAVQVAKIIDDKILEIFDGKTKGNGRLLAMANECYTCKGRTMRIIHPAEIDILTLAREFGSPAVIDERTLRLLIEDPEDLRTLLERRLHSDVDMNKENVKRFRKEVSEVKIIRSAELVATAFTMGLFDELVPKMKKGREVLLDAVLWGVKSDGCAITEAEILEIKEVVLNG